MPIETFPNNGSADKAGKWKERELQIFNPSPSESNLGRGKKKVKILHQNTRFFEYKQLVSKAQ